MTDELSAVRAHRVLAFCNWLDTVAPEPPFHTRPEFRFFADMTHAEDQAASNEMRRRAELDLAAIDALQLRTFLGELRAGTDIDSAAVVAEMSSDVAKCHAEAELRGDYIHVIGVDPSWRVEGGSIHLKIAGYVDLPPLHDDGEIVSYEDLGPQAQVAVIDRAPDGPAGRNVIGFPDRSRQRDDEDRASERLKAIHDEKLALDELASDLGTPAEWLATAISHLKVQSSDRRQRAGIATVSVAALDLVLMHLEALEHGGEPWRGGAA